MAEKAEKKFYAVAAAPSMQEIIDKGYEPHTIAEHEALLAEMHSAADERARARALDPERVYARWNSQTKAPR